MLVTAKTVVFCQRGFLGLSLAPGTGLEPSQKSLNPFSSTSILSENTVPAEIEPLVCSFLYSLAQGFPDHIPPVNVVGKAYHKTERTRRNDLITARSNQEGLYGSSTAPVFTIFTTRAPKVREPLPWTFRSRTGIYRGSEAMEPEICFEYGT